MYNETKFNVRDVITITTLYIIDKVRLFFKTYQFGVNIFRLQDKNNNDIMIMEEI